MSLIITHQPYSIPSITRVLFIHLNHSTLVQTGSRKRWNSCLQIKLNKCCTAIASARYTIALLSVTSAGTYLQREKNDVRLHKFTQMIYNLHELCNYEFFEIPDSRFFLYSVKISLASSCDGICSKMHSKLTKIHLKFLLWTIPPSTNLPPPPKPPPSLDKDYPLSELLLHLLLM